MDIPTLDNVETNLRHCLLLKADDLYFTLAEPHGHAMRNDFLGLTVEGLAEENLSENDIASIDLGRFAVAEKIRGLHMMLEDRRLSLDNEHLPDVEFDRNDALDFLEHFLSTLPNVALGGIDFTSARNGEVRKVYNLAYAWLNLIETIEGAFYGETESTLAVNDLALLTELDTRTVRNRCGPGKIIRTSTTRAAQQRGRASPAFVFLHSLDAIDWLRSRKDFVISTIDPAWLARQLHDANPANATRGLLVASVVNLGALSKIAPAHNVTPEHARDWFDEGRALPPATRNSLIEQLRITN
ncbi:hypothetical protein [Sphingorhabdus sp. 109]|jgi:hypothetical protein|uniref:hypothetical protein n=1 Tax=Sphingorhabdus sp. 109 TaxID=2653173 RepID=UPI0012EF618A|nr:hypothetical protein [Sphingorhabdus sp. 109]VWX57301.1 conserved hypothetical protein [Sphingorhabdus sp. 109]